MFARFNTKMLVMTAVCIALSLVLNQLTLFRMPQGGSVTAGSMFFIVLAGYWFGPVVGIIAGFAAGLLSLMLGGYVVHPIQLLLDYPLAYGALGLAGFFRKLPYGLHIGYTVGVMGKFFMSFLSGVVFFGVYAPPGQPVALYSAIYNISYIWPEALVTLIIISVPAFRQVVDRINK
jgi:thiamine transporter